MVKHSQTICQQQPTNCLSVFDHLDGLAFKGLTLKAFSHLFVFDFEHEWSAYSLKIQYIFFKHTFIMLQLLYEQSQQNAQSESSSPTTPTYKRHIQLLDPERRRSSCFHRSSSYEPFSPIRDEPVSNLVRMRNNSSLGNSDPSLSTSSVSFLLSYFSFFLQNIFNLDISLQRTLLMQLIFNPDLGRFF